MKKQVRGILQFLELLARVWHPALAWKIFRLGGVPMDFARAHGKVVVRDVNMIVDANNVSLLARASAEMRCATAGADVQWRLTPERHLEAKVADLRFEMTSAADAFVIGEVFAAGVYAMTYPGPVIVIDIGANIGISSVFFASKPWVRHVYAFEPLKPTAQVARANIDRNPKYKAKITLFEYGLGAKDETIQVEFSPEWKGQTGRMALPEKLKRVAPSWMETIAVRTASQSLKEILLSATDCAVVLKMDCEGAEWDILPELARSGVLSRIQEMVFEWHHNPPDPLEELLVKNGFSVIHRREVGNNAVGLIYAVQPAKK